MSAEGGGIAPTVAAQLRAAVARLEAASVPGARWDAEILLAFCLGRDRTYLYGHPEAALDPAVQVTYEALLTRRERREPLAYLTGYREFLGLRLQIGPGVLIPRPETEHLVQFAAERLPVGAKILDVGTGSGCVALGVATLRRDVQVTAVDAAPEAIRIARANAEALGLADRVRVELGRFPEVGQGLYQGILSNPPYIPTGDLAGLEPEVGGFEPRLALDGGGDGLE
ncbi:MAG: peptide chain release factor N(5)-glutamine methyltransferase, partial [Armatimonadetes bacterium]|nr:peptide chain release factor N(5)-glutamine methyltransferase [Armatimonadota bacterium]